MKESTKKALTTAALVNVGCLGALALATGIIILNGLVLAQLWTWFMVPIFALPKLSIPAALGISTIAGRFTGSLKREETNVWGQVFGGALISLGIGYIIQLFL